MKKLCCSGLQTFAFLTALITLLLLFSAPSQARSAGMNEQGFDSSESCGKCHTQIYDRWKESMHSRATSDPIFQASYMEAHYKSGGEAEKICLTCHAPTSKITHGFNLDVSLTSEGITCDFCHSIEAIHREEEYPFEFDLGLTKYGPNKNGDVKQHKVAYSPLHGKSEFCATCHEYTPGGVPVMTTFTEWKESVYADEGKNCQYCHMPQVEGEIAAGIVSERGKRIFSHDLAGSHSITQLKKALALKVVKIDRKSDRVTVKVDITNIGSGHRVPTGMPTRKLILYCEVRAPGGKVYKDKVIYEKAIFDKDGYELTSDADIMLGMGESIAKDNRIYPKETRTETFTFYVPESKRVTVSTWVDYLYSPVIMEKTDMRIEMNRQEATSSGR